jgi:hypothetical protein
MKTHTHALIGIRTYDFSVQAIKAYTPDSSATGTGFRSVLSVLFRSHSQSEVYNMNVDAILNGYG